MLLAAFVARSSCGLGRHFACGGWRGWSRVVSVVPVVRRGPPFGRRRAAVRPTFIYYRNVACVGKKKKAPQLYARCPCRTLRPSRVTSYKLYFCRAGVVVFKGLRQVEAAVDHLTVGASPNFVNL